MKKTPLYDSHIQTGGKMVEFAGYLLPIQYGGGLIEEHNAVRNGCGLFDVSHMGEVFLKGQDCLPFLQHLLSNDFTTMKSGECRYTLMCNEHGGIVDDLIVYKFGDCDYLLVVNASNTDKDFQWINAHLAHFNVTTQNRSDEIGQIALQGPNAESVIADYCAVEQLPQLHYTFTPKMTVCSTECLVSRTGYTGEDGFEIYCASKDVKKVFDVLSKDDRVTLCGLGCRDTLRFEAAMPLYGHELRDDYMGNEVGLNFFVKTDKEFVGRDAIVAQPPKYKRKGLSLIDKGIAREGCQVLDESGNVIGVVTTGTFAPTLKKAIAMARINKDFDGQTVQIDVRGKLLRAEIVPMPFYKRKKQGE